MLGSTQASIPKPAKECNIGDSVKIVTIPVGQNRLTVRLENLADKYDKNSKTETVDLFECHLRNLWDQANPALAGQRKLRFVVKEVTLTGNMGIEEMQARKLKWRTVDDDKPGLEKDMVSPDPAMPTKPVTVEPQRIRVFDVLVIAHGFDQGINLALVSNVVS